MLRWPETSREDTVAARKPPRQGGEVRVQPESGRCGQGAPQEELHPGTTLPFLETWHQSRGGEGKDPTTPSSLLISCQNIPLARP